PVRDHQFYYESGDCIIRAEDTLFKIHKFVITQDSAVFSSLFSLPQGSLVVEGSSDDLPITLEGENANDIRSLPKYLYAP
ncbi:hypothetical protein B0H13DRAFT_1569175, partial [Mycena leptocephala]